MFNDFFYKRKINTAIFSTNVWDFFNSGTVSANLRDMECHRDTLEYTQNKMLILRCVSQPSERPAWHVSLRTQHKYNWNTIQFKDKGKQNKTAPTTFFTVRGTLILERKTLIHPGLNFYMTHNKETYHITEVPSTNVWVEEKKHCVTVFQTIGDMLQWYKIKSKKSKFGFVRKTFSSKSHKHQR